MMNATPFSGERPAYAFIITDEIARKAKLRMIEDTKEEIISKIIDLALDLALFNSQDPDIWQDVRDFAEFSGGALPHDFPKIDREFLLNWCRVLEGQGFNELLVLRKLSSVCTMFGGEEVFLQSSIYEDKGAIVVLVPDYAFTSEELKVLLSGGIGFPICVFDGHGREIPFEYGDYEIYGNFNEYGCRGDYAWGDFCYPDPALDNYETCSVKAVCTVEVLSLIHISEPTRPY